MILSIFSIHLPKFVISFGESLPESLRDNFEPAVAWMAGRRPTAAMHSANINNLNQMTKLLIAFFL